MYDTEAQNYYFTVLDWYDKQLDFIPATPPSGP